ncbi:hypothetical protein CP97_15064 (plasmid) [Aurantiacibacter atlanticus]|uniref:Uncharacterized protein n=1 Tax=Aurantiacibacter atlanticus TaxID=1648404 RepID=A0A160HUT2_9SPHN|nr:hypothetical protein CP97_15064 [Aurantiacibacter atlanticus]
MVLSHVAHGRTDQLVTVLRILSFDQEGERKLGVLEDGERTLAIECDTQLEHRQADIDGGAYYLGTRYALCGRVGVEGFESIGGEPYADAFVGTGHANSFRVVHGFSIASPLYIRRNGKGSAFADERYFGANALMYRHIPIISLLSSFAEICFGSAILN